MPLAQRGKPEPRHSRALTDAPPVPRLVVQHRYLLIARMQITPYNLHVLGSFSPSLGCFERTKFTRGLGADTVI